MTRRGGVLLQLRANPLHEEPLQVLLGCRVREGSLSLVREQERQAAAAARLASDISMIGVEGLLENDEFTGQSWYS